VELLEDRSLMSGVSFSLPTSYGDGFTVAVGDFNGDGKPDLAVTNSSNNAVGILQGNGDGTFQPVGNYAVGSRPLSVAVGDFNRDGRADLAVADAGSNSFRVLLGNGDGTFQTAGDFATGSSPQSVAVGDFNGDGRPDLAVTNHYSDSVSVLPGNGDGTFGPAVNYPTGSFPTTVAVGDFNGDGKPDLAVANEGSGTVSLLLGNGTGSFPTIHSFAAGSSPSPFALAVGDFNGDGEPDVAVVNISANDLCVLLGNGDGTLQPAVPYLAGNFPTSVAVGDFNGDGKPDLAVANELDHDVGILLGNGDGTFVPGGHFITGSYPVNLAVGDFNGDNRPDLAIGGSAATVLLNEVATTTTQSGSTSSTYGQPVTYTASVTSGAPVTVGTVTFLDGGTPISPALSLDANGRAAFTVATSEVGSHTITASYSGTPDGAGTTGWGPSSASTTVNVATFVLTGSAVNFGATAGAPFTGTVATFTNPIPFGSTAHYYATIDWGDGSSSTGTITSADTLTVSGSHTYADPGSYALTVEITNYGGDTTGATVYPTATVTTLGQHVQDGLTGGIGFWHNKNGQALIDAFNGGRDATALSYWLAATFPNLYGNLGGISNTQVAAFYQTQLATPGSNLPAEVLATALNVYATTQSLGGAAAQAYGFTVTADGLGADSFNVGADGAAFGVANNTTLNVYELLVAVNQQSAYVVLYNGNTTLQKEANDLFDALNKAGAIS
jgi:hypothetical protein